MHRQTSVDIKECRLLPIAIPPQTNHHPAIDARHSPSTVAIISTLYAVHIQ